MKKNGKYSNKGLNMKPLAILLALTLLVGCAIGGTIAWLTAQTDPVENTFTVGDINITLQEHALKNDGTLDPTSLLPKDGQSGNTYNFVPGDTLPKDPFVTVAANSEPCYLFIKVTVSNNDLTDPVLNTILHFDIAEGWVCINEVGATVNKPAAVADFTTGTYYFYRQVDAETAKTGVTYNVLAGQHEDKCASKANNAACNCNNQFRNGYVKIDENVTKAMVEKINGNTEKGITAAKPVLKVEAAAVQQDNIANVETAISKITWPTT